jgi:two-component system CheB/CheR fusion protein
MPNENTSNADVVSGQAPGEVFPVVGLGASAGGLNALQQFFASMPADSGMGFVVILHLSPEHESHAAEILQKSTQMPVTQVNERVRVEPNRVYVIPPNKHLLIEGSHLALAEMQRAFGRQVAVDTFFRALAETRGSRAACVVLSGAGSDGSAGLKWVKDHGGVSLAQDPREAEYDAMPRSAINTGLVDFTLPVAEMAGRLIEFWRGAGRIELPRLDAADGEESRAAEKALREILETLLARTGHDFSHYKRATVLRRIERRMLVNSASDLSSYRDLLEESPSEAASLLKDLLIGVTNFFRDREAWDALGREIVPRLFEEKRPGDKVRVWVAGCATGEEAYSVTMLLLEQAASLQRPPEIQVFATDIDEGAISVARAGFYPAEVEEAVSPERLRRFFTEEGGGFRVNKEVRDLILFAKHSLIKDPPFSSLDLVTCRNLFIYLDREAQSRVFSMMNFSLRPGGYLFLGGSESIDVAPDLFTTLDKKHRLYRANGVPRAFRILSGLSLGRTAPPGAPRGLGKASASRRRLAHGRLRQQLPQRYAPPSLIVSGNGEIVHLSEDAGRYILHQGGEPTLNLLNVVLPELRLELRAALSQSAQTGKSILSRRVRLEGDGQDAYVSMVVRPMQGEGGEGGYALVAFEAVEEVLGGSGKDLEGRDDEPFARGLEEENRLLKDHLQDIIEQHETALEDLKAANEELQAVNEELRLTGEELETSKEELQSANEELLTVNQELKHKIEETNATNDDLRNLMSSTDIATIFLDEDLRVKRFTARATDTFNLVPTDEGRRLADFTHRLEYPELISDAQTVLDTRRPLEREVESRQGETFLARLAPYRTAQDRHVGVVLNFLNITDRKLAEGRVEEARVFAESIVEAVREPLVILSADLRVRAANRAFYETFRLMPEKTLNQYVYDLGARQWDIPELRRMLEAVLPEHRQFNDYEVEREFEGIGRRAMLLNAREVTQAASRTRLILLAIEDVTERKRLSAQLRSERERLKYIFEKTPAYVALMRGPDHIYEVVNPAQERFLKERQLLGKAAREAFPEIEGQGYFDILDRVYRTGAPYASHEARFIFQSAPGEEPEEVFMDLLYQPIRGADGEVSGIFSYAVDVTEQVKARRAAQAAGRLKDEFLATLSHELRNPLNSIVGYSEVLRRSPEAEQSPLVRQAADAIQRGAEAQAQLINDLLDLSRLQTGKLRVDRRPVNLISVVVDAVESVRGDADGNGVRLEVKSPTESLMVNADPVRLQQIVWNLLSNAMKFTPRGGRVSVSLGRRTDSANLVVEDSGQGIAPEFLRHVFEMFRQADAGAARAHGGLGIGLALVRQLTELHDGRVEAYSEGPGRGARFTVTLPLHAAAAAERDSPVAKAEEELNDARILVVDDSQDSLNMLQLLLSVKGAAISTANNGKDALRLAESAEFDLILSDISMPGMDGYEFLQTLRERQPRYKTVPAIALTGFGREEDVEKAQLAGFTTHLTKPIDFKNLLRLARVALLR